MTNDERINNTSDDDQVKHMADDDAQMNKEVSKLRILILYTVQMILICFQYSFWYYEFFENVFETVLQPN